MTGQGITRNTWIPTVISICWYEAPSHGNCFTFNLLSSCSSHQTITGLYLLDLSAAFHVVNNSILLKRLSHWFGFQDVVLAGIASYLLISFQSRLMAAFLVLSQFHMVCPKNPYCDHFSSFLGRQCNSIGGLFRSFLSLLLVCLPYYVLWPNSAR